MRSAHAYYPSRVRTPSTRTHSTLRAHLNSTWHAPEPVLARTYTVYRARTRQQSYSKYDKKTRMRPCSRAVTRGFYSVETVHLHLPVHPRTPPLACTYTVTGGYEARLSRALTPQPPRARTPYLVLKHTTFRAHVHRPRVYASSNARTRTVPGAHPNRHLCVRTPSFARAQTVHDAHANRLSLTRTQQLLYSMHTGG